MNEIDLALSNLKRIMSSLTNLESRELELKVSKLINDIADDPKIYLSTPVGTAPNGSSTAVVNCPKCGNLLTVNLA